MKINPNSFHELGVVYKQERNNMFRFILGELDIEVKVVKDKKNQYSKSDVSVKCKIRYDNDYIEIDIDKGKVKEYCDGFVDSLKGNNNEK